MTIGEYNPTSDAEVIFRQVEGGDRSDYLALTSRLAQEVYEFRRAQGDPQGDVAEEDIRLGRATGYTASLVAPDDESAIIKFYSDGDDESVVVIAYQDEVLMAIDSTGEAVPIQPDGDGIQMAILVTSAFRIATLKRSL